MSTEARLPSTAVVDDEKKKTALLQSLIERTSPSPDFRFYFYGFFLVPCGDDRMGRITRWTSSERSVGTVFLGLD